jgi:hypothetical protein
VALQPARLECRSSLNGPCPEGRRGGAFHPVLRSARYAVAREMPKRCRSRATSSGADGARSSSAVSTSATAWTCAGAGRRAGRLTPRARSVRRLLGRLRAPGPRAPVRPRAPRPRPATDATATRTRSRHWAAAGSRARARGRGARAARLRRSEAPRPARPAWSHGVPACAGRGGLHAGGTRGERTCREHKAQNGEGSSGPLCHARPPPQSRCRDCLRG